MVLMPGVLLRALGLYIPKTDKILADANSNKRIKNMKKKILLNWISCAMIFGWTSKSYAYDFVVLGAKAVAALTAYFGGRRHLSVLEHSGG